VLISSWLVHWVFWIIVVWVAFLLNDIAGWIVAVPVALWFLTLIYLAARYPFVRIELTKDQARMVGFFRSKTLNRDTVRVVTSSQGSPPLVFVILGPQLTSTSIYWMPGAILNDDSAIWFGPMFARQREVQRQVDMLEQWRRR
jgi:hypothetical protein